MTSGQASDQANSAAGLNKLFTRPLLLGAYMNELNKENTTKPMQQMQTWCPKVVP